MLLTRVKRPGEHCWHYVLSSELKPVCPCGCKHASIRRKTGDTLCRCPCHRAGKKLTLALCEKLVRQKAKVHQLSLMPSLAAKAVRKRPWTAVIGRDQGCLTCMALGTKLTKGEVQFLLEEIATHEVHT
jgi:hypothetical protein